ncbi:hemicentin-1 isoform X2 [Thalassophryne amazonica]|uniref:hemicentin-1 isoform X2 n=1 Tax=Thalassophryne amazonica TaxID=390379 RepID=UPI001471E6E3|nr:hemicentin-1 isoform X2 [Thalassophryne amazonica]
MTSASEIQKFAWFKKSTLILIGIKYSFLLNAIESRSIFTPSDGTFRINNLSRSDGGEYVLNMYNSNGKLYGKRTLQLFIQAPVSSVLLVSECLSRGEMRASCSSEGGDSQYRWTLDGRTLTDADLLSGHNETTNITLKQGLSGRLVCTVSNHISKVSKEENISTCPAPVSSVLLVSECLSRGEMRASCSSEGGDSPQYSWTLDGRTLTDTDLLSGHNETTNITLKQGLSGRLVCTVSNHISKVSKEENISTCAGEETYCDGRQNGAQCYGALGGTLALRLMTSASEIHTYEWLKNTTKILTGKERKFSVNAIENRYIFTPSDGTFGINNLSRSDGGEYVLNMFDSNGKLSEKRTLQLFIQAPVSSVLLVSECLSRGEMRASCSSEGGDSPQYSWTLDGRTLTDADLLSGHETTNITLKQGLSGRLVCTVSNHISKVSKEENISTCAAPVSSVLLVSECLSRGEMRASCSSEGGDSPQYSWTLDGRTLTDADLLSGHNETTNITLKQGLSGRLVCTVSNHISKVSKEENISTCAAPVSSVLLVSECLSRGQMRASCSSEGGDSPQYSWTLDGRTLTDTDLLSGHNETTNITLKQGLSGRLVCTVSNHISKVSKEENISTCAGFIFINCTLSNGTLISQWVFEANNTLCIEPTTISTTVPETPASPIGKETDSVSNKTFTHITPSNQTAASADEPWYIKHVPIMAGVLVALVTLFLASIAVYCCKNKKQSKEHHEEEEDHEVTYADVKILQCQTRPKHKMQEMEVEYGQVKVSGERWQTTEPTEDDCVYAKVRKNL